LSIRPHLSHRLHPSVFATLVNLFPWPIRKYVPRQTIWRSPNRFLEADKILRDRMFAVPETIDELVKSLENPHIPETERIDKEDDDTIYFKDEEKAMDVVSLKLGVVPEWLQQRYKSKFAKVKESPEQKELRQKASAEEAATKKRKADTEARESLEKIVKDMPPPEASLQDRRAWELEFMQGATPLFTFFEKSFGSPKQSVGK
jgi:hypothetical protein